MTEVAAHRPRRRLPSSAATQASARVFAYLSRAVRQAIALDARLVREAKLRRLEASRDAWGPDAAQAAKRLDGQRTLEVHLVRWDKDGNEIEPEIIHMPRRRR